jgi:hypothetical protein
MPSRPLAISALLIAITSGAARGKPAEVAFEPAVVPDDEDDAEEAPIEDPPPAPAPKRWHLAIGPYVWASSVHAELALGPIDTSVDVGFLDIVSHVDRAAAASLAVSRGKLSFDGSLQTSTLSLGTSRDIGPITAGVEGSVDSLLVEASAGYAVLGSDTATRSIEVRPGIRYQGLTVHGGGTLGIGDSTVGTGGEFSDGGIDYLVGARGRYQVSRRWQLSATGDLGVAGYSDSTWSLSAHATVQVVRWFAIAGGWRTLSNARGATTMQLSGPQIALMLTL